MEEIEQEDSDLSWDEGFCSSDRIKTTLGRMYQDLEEMLPSSGDSLNEDEQRLAIKEMEEFEPEEGRAPPDIDSHDTDTDTDADDQEPVAQEPTKPKNSSFLARLLSPLRTPGNKRTSPAMTGLDTGSAAKTSRRRKKLSLSLGRASGAATAANQDPDRLQRAKSVRSTRTTSWRSLFTYFEGDSSKTAAESADRIQRPS